MWWKSPLSPKQYTQRSTFSSKYMRKIPLCPWKHVKRSISTLSRTKTYIDIANLPMVIKKVLVEKIWSVENTFVTNSIKEKSTNLLQNSIEQLWNFKLGFSSCQLFLQHNCGFRLVFLATQLWFPDPYQRCDIPVINT